MPPVKLSLHFNDDSAVYFGGQKINGRVDVHCSKDKVLKGLTLTAKGASSVHWTEREDGNTVSYSSSEQYYNFSYVLSSSTECQLSVGTHSFPFSLVLPEGIPCSFEGSYGYVRHKVKALADIEGKFFNVKVGRRISVSSPYDLNLISGASKPISLSKHRNLCCLCCKDGQISFVVKIGHSGFVPGENMLIDAECHNGSRSSRCYAEAQLFQIVTYRAGDDEKVSKKMIRSTWIKGPRIDPGEDEIWSRKALTIPPLPPSNLPYCKIIGIKYELQFSFIPIGFSYPVKESVPIYIGTIPLREAIYSQPHWRTPHSILPAPVIHSDPSVDSPVVVRVIPTEYTVSSTPAPTSDQNDPPPPYPWAEQYPYMPPPSYQECGLITSSSMKDSDDEDNGDASNSKFVPQYVTYG